MLRKMHFCITSILNRQSDGGRFVRVMRITTTQRKKKKSHSFQGKKKLIQTWLAIHRNKTLED